MKKRALELCYQDPRPLTFTFGDDEEDIVTTAFWLYRDDETTGILALYANDGKVPCKMFSRHFVLAIVEWMQAERHRKETLGFLVDPDSYDEDDEDMYAEYLGIPRIIMKHAEFLHFLGLESLKFDLFNLLVPQVLKDYISDLMSVPPDSNIHDGWKDVFLNIALQHADQGCKEDNPLMDVVFWYFKPKTPEESIAIPTEHVERLRKIHFFRRCNRFDVSRVNGLARQYAWT